MTITTGTTITANTTTTVLSTSVTWPPTTPDDGTAGVREPRTPTLAAPPTAAVRSTP